MCPPLRGRRAPAARPGNRGGTDSRPAVVGGASSLGGLELRLLAVLPLAARVGPLAALVGLLAHSGPVSLDRDHARRVTDIDQLTDQRLTLVHAIPGPFQQCGAGRATGLIGQPVQ